MGMSPRGSLLQKCARVRRLRQRVTILFEQVTLIFIIARFRDLGRFVTNIAKRGRFVGRTTFYHAVEIERFVFMVFSCFLFFFEDKFPVRSVCDSHDSRGNCFHL